jgi:histidinol phosphatase-like enzyme (inositol monophosphatase family)
VIGEEYGEDRPDAEFVWVLDPVDGTRAFICGLPVWTTLIGLRHNGTPVLGSIGQSYIGELFIGGIDRGSRLISRGESRPLKTRPCPGLSDALIATTDPIIFRDLEAAAWTRLRRAVRLARLGCDAYAYAMVASGALDLVVETGLKAWDIDAAIPVIAGAGGITTDWEGRPVGAHGGRVAIAGDRACLEQALAALAG